MGWWKTENNLQLGDLPIDSMTLMLIEVKKGLTKSYSIQEFVLAFSKAVDESEIVSSKNENPTWKLIIWDEFEVEYSSAAVLNSPFEKNLISHFLESLKSVSDTYMDALNRKPTLNELYACLAVAISTEHQGIINPVPNQTSKSIAVIERL